MSELIAIDAIPAGYIPGLGRSVPHPRISHLYEGPFTHPGKPLCPDGWNRNDGMSYSIWRNCMGADGVCSTCLKRARAGEKGVPAL